tara:strand:- start:5069 stop:5698 length:630 start_codon:yes stop_codon:yes gene_type:complete
MAGRIDEQIRRGEYNPTQMKSARLGIQNLANKFSTSTDLEDLKFWQNYMGMDTAGDYGAARGIAGAKNLQYRSADPEAFSSLERQMDILRGELDPDYTSFSSGLRTEGDGSGEQQISYPQRITPMQSPYRFQQEMGPAYFGVGGLQGRKKKQKRSATGNFWNQIGGGQGAAYQGQLAPMVNQAYQRVTGLFSQGGSQQGGNQFGGSQFG